MFFWKNSNLIYKNFLKFFSSKLFNSKLKNYINFTNIKFEIKLYLIGLSFNRFLFNIDKFFINLCIISNFLFFLSIYKPKILLVGNSEYSSYFKFFSYETNNLYYEYKLLPGSIIGIIEAAKFALRHQFDIFNNNFDCIILFFYYPNIQFIKEIYRRYIPIIGIVEVDSPKFVINTLTYSLFSVENKKNIFFYLSYFIKILQNKSFKKYQHYSFKYIYKKNLIKYIKKSNNFILFNSVNLPNLFYNINKFIKLINNYFKPIEFNKYYIFIINFIYFIQKKILKLSLKKIIKNTNIKKKFNKNIFDKKYFYLKFNKIKKNFLLNKKKKNK